MVKKSLTLFAVALLSACGGGGGSPASDNAGAQSTQQGAAIVSVSPDAINISTAAGTSGRATVTAVSADPAKSIWEIAPYVYFVDEAQVLAKDVEFDELNDKSVHATFHTPATLAPGHYHGSVQVHFCNDMDCKTSVAGSPVSIPYDVTVTDPSAP